MKFLFGSALMVLVVFSGCGDKKEEQKSVQKQKVEPVKQSVIKKKAEDLKVTANKAIDEGAKIAEKITVESKVIAKEVIAQTKQMTTVAMQTANDMKKEIVEQMDVVTKSAQGIDAKQLFVKCAGCHGQNAGKKALNVSASIKDWDKEKIVNAIKGYKAGTYGASMKAIMTSQVSGLSDEEIDALGSYISNMK